MKVITKLEDITRLLKSRDQGQDQDNKKLLFAFDGHNFSSVNKLETLFKCISKIPSNICNISDIQIKISNVQNSSESLYEDLKHLLKLLNFQNLQLQFDLVNFTQDPLTDVCSIFLKLITEVAKKISQGITEQGKSFKLKFNIENQLSVEINQQIVSINYFENMVIGQRISGFIELLTALKTFTKIFQLYFKSNPLTQQEKCDLIQQLEDFTLVEKQKLTINFQDKNLIFENLLRNKNLKNGVYIYKQENNNILSASIQLQDDIKNFQIIEQRQVVLNKVAQKFSLYLNAQKWSQSLNIQQCINSWKMKKLVDIKLNISANLLSQSFSEVIKQFLQNQKNRLKHVSITLNNYEYTEQNSRIFTPIDQLSFLENLKIEIQERNNFLSGLMDTTFFSSRLENLKHIEIILDYQNLRIYKFLSFVSHAINVECVNIKTKCLLKDEITLKDDKIKVLLKNKTISSEIFDYFNEENFKLKKRYSLEIILSNFVSNELIESLDHKLDSFSNQLKSIQIDFQQSYFDLELNLFQEIKRERAFCIYMDNQKIFEKYEFKYVFIKIDDRYIHNLQKLYPEQQIQNLWNLNQVLENNNIIIDNDVIQNANPQQQDVVIIEENEIYQQQEQNNSGQEQIQDQNPDELIVIEDGNALENQKKPKKIKSKRNKEIEKSIYNCPEQFKNLLEIFKSFEMYENIELDFSYVISEQFFELFNKNLSLFRKAKKINLNFSFNQLNPNKLIKWQNLWSNFIQAQTISVNFSNNPQICNQSGLFIFSNFKKCRKNLIQLDIDLSSTSVKQKVLFQLSNKISQFNLLRVFSLNISHTSNQNVIKIQFIKDLFESLNQKFLPSLEKLTIKAAQSALQIDQNFYDILAYNIPQLSQNLKVLKLNFSQNRSLEKVSQKDFLYSLSKLPQDLVQLSLNIEQIYDYTEDQLFTFLKIGQFFKRYEQLEKIKIKSNKYAQVDIQKYALEVLKFLNQINHYYLKKLSIDIYQFQIQINSQYREDKDNQNIEFINSLDNNLNYQFKNQLAEILLNLSPNLNLSQKILKLIQ